MIIVMADNTADETVDKPRGNAAGGGIAPGKAVPEVRKLLLRDPVRRVSAKVPKNNARNKQVAPRSRKELVWLLVAGCV